MVLQGNRAYLVRMDLIWLTAKLKKGSYYSYGGTSKFLILPIIFQELFNSVNKFSELIVMNPVTRALKSLNLYRTF